MIIEMKKFIKPLIYSLSILVGFTFFLTLLNYIGIISGNVLKILKVFILFLIYFIPSFIIGYKSEKNGWLNGLEISLIITFIMLIINLIIRNKITLISIIIYIIFICVSMVSGIVGINLSKRKS